MTDTKYNGYRNYETWLTNVWLTNDEGTYTFVKDLVADLSVEDAATELRDYLEDRVCDENVLDGLLADLLASAMAEIDCFELAESFMEA